MPNHTTHPPLCLPHTPSQPPQSSTHADTYTCFCRLSVATLFLPLSNFFLSSHLFHTHGCMHIHTHTHTHTRWFVQASLFCWHPSSDDFRRGYQKLKWCPFLWDPSQHKHMTNSLSLTMEELHLCSSNTCWSVHAVGTQGRWFLKIWCHRFSLCVLKVVNHFGSPSLIALDLLLHTSHQPLQHFQSLVCSLPFPPLSISPDKGFSYK